MNQVLENQTPDRWRVVLVGHIEDVSMALKAIEENQFEAWIGFNCDGDDDEVTAVINLRWVDIAMVRLVGDIIRSDFPYVKIKANRGEYDNEKRSYE